jgi:hypothetical protein
MAKKTRDVNALTLPLMMAELTVASWETVLRRLWMMSAGNCSVAEYRRMVLEKQHAAHRSVVTALDGKSDMAALLAPWHRHATRNARRLRRR